MICFSGSAGHRSHGVLGFAEDPDVLLASPSCTRAERDAQVGDEAGHWGTGTGDKSLEG